ncbi:MAG: glutamate racemase [Betaproteobacteria bacterium]|nr:glutamate racemase [Betaproteobacteria bacterium]
MPAPDRPIGVFDSGVGGLSVLREIRRELPGEDLLYVADSAHAPYGDKPSGFIEARCMAITAFLVARDAKAVVVACNTATGAAIGALRREFALPVVGMEPAVKPAAGNTASGVVGVLATRGTLESARFAGLLARFGSGIEVVVQPAHGLVERVEAGDLEGADTRGLVERYVTPLLRRGADTLVLGCTHYPFIVPLIRDLAGPEVTIMDPGPAVAREVRRRLADENLLAPGSQAGSTRFWTSHDTAAAARLMSRLWGAEVEVERLPAPVAAAPWGRFDPDGA